MNGKKFKKPLSVLLSVLMATSAMPLSAISVSACEAACQTGDCSGTYSNGFCCDCDGYEAAIQTTDKYDVDDDGIMDTVYEIGNAGQLMIPLLWLDIIWAMLLIVIMPVKF